MKLQENNLIGILVLTIALFLLFACSQTNHRESRHTWFLKPGKDLVLHLDSITAPNEIYFQYLKNFRGKETMAFHVRGADMIKFYDLNTGQVHHEIKYPTSGPGALNSIYGFYIHNQDSIFLSQQYHYKLLLVNSKFEKIDEMNLAPENVEFEESGYLPKKGNLIQTASISSRGPLTIISGKVIIPSMYMFRADEKAYTRHGRLYTVYDMRKRSFDYHLNFPEPMQDKLWGGMLTVAFISFNPKTNRIVTSYAGYDQLSVSDPDFTHTEYYKATSQQFKEIRLAYKPYEIVEEEIEHYMGMPTFGGIYYDEYRDVYYRLGKYPKKGDYDPYKSDYLDPMANPRDLVIIVLDSKFQKLTEHTIRSLKTGYISKTALLINMDFISPSWIIPMKINWYSNSSNWNRTMNKLLCPLVFLMAIVYGCQSPTANVTEDDQLINYIEKIKGSNNVNGNYIILADNACQGCRKIVQQYAAASSRSEMETLIIRDIKNLALLKEDFKDYPGTLYLDSLKIYGKAQLKLPPAISISIHGNIVRYNPLELP